MKGLIRKDLLYVRYAVVTECIITAAIVFFFGIGGMVTGEMVLIQPVISMALLYLFAICFLTITMGCFAADEQCGWDVFGNTLPVSRTDVVLARYGLCLGMVLIHSAIQLCVQLIGAVGFGLPILPHYHLALASFCLLTAAVEQPVAYRFGSQIAGFLLAGIMVLLNVSVILSTRLGSRLAEAEEIEAVPQQLAATMEAAAGGSMLPGLLGLLGICAGLYVLSIGVSVSIYQKKDF